MKSKYVEFPAKNKVTVGVEDISTENLDPLEVIVKNEVSMVSAGTELSRLHGLEVNASYPTRPGYASIGTILQKGDAVTDFEVGDRVFYAGKHASVQRFLHGQNHQWGRLYPVPENLKPEDAVYVCLAEIAAVAPWVTELDLNDTVAVFGLGVIGNLTAQLYSLMGAKVIALDPVAKRCELARSVGIDTVVDVAPDKQVQAILDRTDGKGADVTVDVVGHSAVVVNCIDATALYGQVILLGTPRAPYTADMTEPLQKVHLNGLVVRGALQWRFPAMELREVKKSVAWGFRSMFDLIGSGKLKVDALRSHILSPDEAPKVYEGLENDRENYWGVVFDWREKPHS